MFFLENRRAVSDIYSNLVYNWYITSGVFILHKTQVYNVGYKKYPVQYVQDAKTLMRKETRGPWIISRRRDLKILIGKLSSHG